MLSTAPIIVFTATRDAARAREFYEHTLGLTFVADEPYALVFTVSGATLRVAKVGELTPAKHTVLGWVVPDIQAEVGELTKRGVRFEIFPGLGQDAAGIWKSPSGAQIVWFRDPDGNTLSLTEYAP